MPSMSEKRWTWSSIRFGLVCLTWALVTLSYYVFHHLVHKPRTFEPGSEKRRGPPHVHRQDWIFLYGLALPMLVLTVVSLIWNPSTNTKGTKTDYASATKKENTHGDVNVRKWTIICFVVPLYLIMLDGARGHHVFNNKSEEDRGWNLYIRICMSLMSPSGYAAAWALALFLIPVTKHSPILDWLHVTPVQALAFHRVSGWVGFWNSVLHGFLHLRHLMDVLNPQRERKWYEQLKFLLIPSSWKCYITQNPFYAFMGRQDPYDGTTEEAQQCRLALVNLTGMISVIAFSLLAITSLPQVRRYSYALFYSVHIPSAWIMLIMAIWHYPTCALILIPNIIYYLSFHIPVFVAQKADSMKAGWESKKDDYSQVSPLVEANLIQGGSIELIFAATPKDVHRHESRFARLFCPSVSPLYHPFSIFSRNDLVHAGKDVTSNPNHSSSPTVSMLLRPSGPFTEKLTKVLFESDTNVARITNEESEEFIDEVLASISRPLIQPTLPCKIQVDSYYAGSFDWVDRAMKSHDEILLVAGGVGITPFLEFLPSLQQRIQMDTAANEAVTDLSLVDNEAMLESTSRLGPSKIHLHWYCREMGLASYIWNNLLCRHVEEAWENDPICQGRLKIHFHLTSLSPDAAGEEILGRISNQGLIKKHKYSTASQDDTTTRPVQDALFTQSLWFSLLLPGFLVLVGTILHWWWYRAFVTDEKFKRFNLVIRSYSIGFSLLLAIVLSALVELCLRYREYKARVQGSYLPIDSDSESSSGVETASTTSTSTGSPDRNGSINTPECPSFGNHRVTLTVSGGRPLIESVVSDVIDSDRPGIYSCGPHLLMESLESAARRMGKDCAFYREDSEM